MFISVCFASWKVNKKKGNFLNENGKYENEEKIMLQR